MKLLPLPWCPFSFSPSVTPFSSNFLIIFSIAVFHLYLLISWLTQHAFIDASAAQGPHGYLFSVFHMICSSACVLVPSWFAVFLSYLVFALSLLVALFLLAFVLVSRVSVIPLLSCVWVSLRPSPCYDAFALYLSPSHLLLCPFTSLFLYFSIKLLV